jgi:hypothetical protein
MLTIILNLISKITNDVSLSSCLSIPFHCCCVFQYQMYSLECSKIQHNMLSFKGTKVTCLLIPCHIHHRHSLILLIYLVEMFLWLSSSHISFGISFSGWLLSIADIIIIVNYRLLLQSACVGAHCGHLHSIM